MYALNSKVKNILLYGTLILISAVILYLLLIPSLGSILNFLEVRDFDRQSISVNKEVNNWPAVDKWKQYTDEDFKISLRYPPSNWEITKTTDNNSAIVVEWLNWSGGTHLVIRKNPNDGRDIKAQLTSLLEKGYGELNQDSLQFNFTRPDFIEVYNARRFVPEAFFVQRDSIYNITFVNYAAWTSYSKSQKLIDAVNHGLLLVARTIESTSH